MARSCRNRTGTLTEEINEKLQERSQIALAEIAAQLHIGSELVINILEPRLGTIVCFSCFSFFYCSSKFIVVLYFINPDNQ
jgi:hypothetical protein